MKKGAVFKAYLKKDKQPVIIGTIEKMSKSKKNGVDPEGLIKNYGADTVRLYTMFAAPPEQMLEWSDNAVEGSFRFLNNLWKLTISVIGFEKLGQPLDYDDLNESQRDLRRKVHQTIKKVTDDYERRYKFNTAIAAIMELYNFTVRFNIKDEKDKILFGEAVCTTLQLLHPVVPHITESLWLKLDIAKPIDDSWPVFDPSALTKDVVEIVLQVNGKKRSSIRTKVDLNNKEYEKIAKSDEKISKYIGDQEIKKIIIVPNKLINVVI